MDCFKNFELQTKYEVGFIPTVVIYDLMNKEIKRFAREENVNEIVNCILNTN